MLIIDATPQGVGWFPINHMVDLASRLFETVPTVVAAGQRLPWHKRMDALLRGRGTTGGDETCLLICASPADLLQLIEIPGWRRRFRFVAAWVIDSYWIEWIPKTLRLSMPFDQLFVTRGEDIDDWQRAVGIRPSWLPWGADVLALGSATADRPWDLTRVGRQPPDWDDDEATAADAAANSLSFRPRPPEGSADPLAHHLALMQAFGETKFVLAFSNRVNPMKYTHPSRDYITGRWVDALAMGASVAGCAPRGTNVDSLLWPGATLELEATHRNDGLHTIADAVRCWTPEVARINHAQALRRLDWRHRMATIADTFGERPLRLVEELASLEAAIQSHSIDAAAA